MEKENIVLIGLSCINLIVFVKIILMLENINFMLMYC